MKILITGCKGQLGRELQRQLREEGCVLGPLPERLQKATVIPVDVEELDITDREAVVAYVRRHQPDTVINCAAFTNVNGCETARDAAFKVNAIGPRNLALACEKVNARLIHISTDYVFGKEPYNTPCKEDQTGTPTGVYGATKLLGEQKIIATGCKYIIIRTAWLYSEFGKNFCKTMLNLTATKPQLKVVFDQCGTPTYAWDLATAIVTAIKNPVEGIYHYSNEGVCSWFDFTKMIQQIALEVGYYESLPKQGDLEVLCDVQPCHSNEFPSPVTRPSYSVLDKTKIKETFGIKVPYWTDSLKKCINNLKQQTK